MAALEGYRGPLLPGFYQEWVLLERERLQGLFEARMARLLQLLETAGRWDEAQEWATRWIALGDAWSEAAYRSLITAHAASGDVARAIAAFERLAQGLERDLGLAPSEPTRALLARVQAGWKPRTQHEGQAPATTQEATARPARRRQATLPQPLTSFIGRQKEMDELRRLVSGARLATITGPGGVGKTRLAIQVAATLAPQFADGVTWVELAPLPPGEERVAQAVARALRVPQAPGVPLLEAVIEELQGRQALLALDNCEHLVADCAVLVERLLTDCAQLTVLATSREPLGVAGERAWLLPSLSLPSATTASSQIAEAEAVRLFMERAADVRAADVRAASGTTQAEIAAVAQICRRLDGIPLAIELAAARMNMLSAEEIAARLDSRFSLLTAGRRTALARHQTLHAAIEWSYDLLTAVEQRLFRRLAVFAGSFTLEAAEAVCASHESELHAGDAAFLEKERVLDVLGRLVDKSLLQVAAGMQHPELATRYRFLETLHSYAEMKLYEAGERESMCDRHAGYYVTLIETAAPQLLSQEQGRYYRLLQAESENIRAVVEWSVADVSADHGLERAASGLRIVGAILWFWWSHGSVRDGLDLALKVTALPPLPQLLEYRARALNTAAYTYWVLGEMDNARQHLDEALSILANADDEASLAWSLQFRGLVLSSEGQYELADASMREGVAIARRLGDLHKSSFSLAFHGDVALQQGDRSKARRIYKECAELLQSLGNNLFMAYPLRRLGYLALERGEMRKAWSYFHESLLLNQEGGDRRAVLASVTAMAALALQMGELVKASQLLGVVESGLESLALNLLHLDQSELQRVRDALQGRLDAATLDAALAEGWEMGEERAVARLVL